jgi:hypothetical protein
VTAPQYGITIECEASYADPRDNAVTYPVRDSLTLTMSRDATVLYPKIQVLAESAQSFNPLKDINYGNTPATGYYDFKAEADWKGVSADNGSQLYKADALGTEEIVSRTGTLPTTTPIIGNLRYGRGTGSILEENQSFMFRQTSGGTVNPVPDSIAGIEKLKGNTVVWNQSVTLAKVNTALAYNSNATEVVTNNGEITVKTIGTVSAAYERGFVIKNINSVGNIVGHKYLIICFSKTATQFTFEFDSALMGTTKAFVMQNYVANAWCKMTAITTANSTQNNFIMRVGQQPEVGSYIYFKNIQLFDLTLMFGAGNEPSTVEEFEAMFPEPYYAYDAGRLLSFNPAGLKTVGFNLWDEEWENAYLSGGRYVPAPDSRNIASKNFIRVAPNTRYYIRLPLNGKVELYDAEKNYIGDLFSWGGSQSFTTPANCAFLRFYYAERTEGTYNNNVCINLSDATKNGTYEAHWENTCNIDITTLNGKVVTNGVAGGSDVVMFPDGLNGKGTCYDEIDMKLGTAVRRYGKVHLKDVVASVYNNNNGHYYCVTSAISDLKVNRQTTALSTLQCGYDGNQIFNGAYGIGYRVNEKTLNIALASEPTTKAAFESALDGVYLYYELATPIEYTFDPIPQGQWEWYGVSNGVEVRIDTLPAYVSGQGTDTLRVDALYDENMTVICRYRKFPWDTELIPQKEYRMVAWRIPNIDTIVVCKNGSSVNSASTGSYTFETIVNVKGEQLSDAVIAANLRFRWKMRNSYTKQETDLGWGSQNDSSKIAIPVSSLRNATVNGEPVTTTVWCEVYMLGAYEPVTNNGVTTYQRSINNNN